MKNARMWLTLGMGLLPSGVLKNRLLCFVNPSWRIATGVRIRPSVWSNIDCVLLGSSVSVGLGTVLRDLKRLEMEDMSKIGQWNWITSALPLRSLSSESGKLKIGSHAAITSRHYIDCSGGVTVGAYSTVAGVRSTIITHGIDVLSCQQRVGGVSIGERCLVGSNSSFVPGASIADKCVVAMGSVVKGHVIGEGLLLAGVPAVRKRNIPASAGYFNRTVGFVSAGDAVEGKVKSRREVSASD